MKKHLIDYWYLEEKPITECCDVYKECEQFVNSLSKKQYRFFDTLFTAMNSDDKDKFKTFIAIMQRTCDDKLSAEVDEFFKKHPMP